MKRVLFICNYRQGVGGISGQVELLQKHLREDGYIADIFSTKGSFVKRLLMPFRLHTIAKRYDVLHIHCCSYMGFLPAVFGINAGKRLKKRIVLTYHGGNADSFFFKHISFIKRWLGRTDVNIALSGFVGKEFEQYGIPYVIIPNIIDFKEKQYRERTELLPHFICVRTHEPLYNIKCILRAFHKVQSSLPDASLTLVGDGTQHDELVKSAYEMGLKNVDFPGRVDNNRIYEFLNKSDIFLSAPIVDNMPVSVLEAMNAGLLVISSNVGGVPYMIENNRLGLLFESDDDTQLAELMLWAVSHQKESIQIIRNAKHDVSKYCWTDISVKIKKVYEDDWRVS